MGKSGSEGRGKQTTARKRGIGGSPLTLLPESQSPDDENDASVGTTPGTDAMLCDGLGGWPSQPSELGALPSEGNQGDEWDAYVTLDTYDRDERGINPQGREARG